MAIDFESLITKQAGEDGSIHAANIAKLASALSSAVGREFIPKERYNAKLDEIETLKADKQTAEDSLNAAGKWEAKYNKMREDFEAFKADAEAKAKLSEVKAAYRKLLTDEGIAAKYLDTVIRATSFDGMKIDADGKLEKADELKTAIGNDWSDFKVNTRTDGAKVDTPPKGDGTGANPRAAEIARKFHERRYGAAPASDGANNNNG